MLKRAAALLFAEEPENYVTGAYIKMGFFESNTEIRYQDEIRGNLFLQVDKAMDLLLTKYMKAYISYEGLQRIERYIFPAPALREALLNAVVHKDYSSSNPVQISVYHNKIVIWNAGRLPEQISIETLHQKHPSIPYNPLLASAFFRSGNIEAWGRGIEKIMIACLAENAPLPLFNYEFAGLMVTFDAGDTSYLEASKEEMSEEMSEESIKELSTKTAKKTLGILKHNPTISISELSELIGVTTRTIERQLKKLKSANLIRRVGSNKSGYWEVIRQNGKK